MHIKAKAAAAEQPQGKAQGRPKRIRALLHCGYFAGGNATLDYYHESIDSAGWQTVGRRNKKQNERMTAALSFPRTMPWL